MEESLRTRFIVVLAITNIIFLLALVNSCNDNRKIKVARDSEMEKRLTSEEKLETFNREKGSIQQQLQKVQQQLDEEKAAADATKKALVQEQLVNESLKNELEKLSRLKQALEEDLKQALVKGKIDKTRK